MKPEDKELAEKVIKFFKDSDRLTLIPERDFPHLIKSDDISKKVMNSLVNHYNLLKIEGTKNKYFSLTKKGYEFTTFENLEKDSKKTPLTLYQKIYIPLFILFGFSAMILSVLNYNSNQKNDVLKSQVDSLTTEFHIYKDSVGMLKSQIELLTKQNLNDSSQTKSYLDVKID